MSLVSAGVGTAGAAGVGATVRAGNAMISAVTGSGIVISRG